MPKRNIALTFVFGIGLGLVCLFLIYKYNETRPVTESFKTEMKEVPSEVKKQMSTTTPLVRIKVPILMYHYVEYVQDKRDTIRQSLDIVPPVFEGQIKTLVDAGYTFMTARDLGDVIDQKTQLPPKPILITIDDGHWDVDTVILPILKKYHAKATAYVIPGFTGGSDFMSKNQVQDVIDSGLVEIGAHTVHHISLKGKKLTTVTSEVQQSKKMLEDTYHISVASFAYPNGSFDLQAIGAVAKAGYVTAVSTIPGVEVTANNRYFLYRLRPGNKTGKVLLDWLQQKVG